MKRNFLLLLTMSALFTGVSAQYVNSEVTGFVASDASDSHVEHNDGKLSGNPFRIEDRKHSTRAIESSGEIKYREPANLFSMGYTYNLSYYNRVTRRGAAYKPQTWKNTTEQKGDYTFGWTYDSPDGPGQGENLVQSSAEELVVSYPFNNGWWKAPALTAKVSNAEIVYAPNVIYRFGGPSAITTMEATLDFGMTPYSEMLYRDVNGKRTTTFGSLKYAPTAIDPYSVTKWTPVLPEKKDLKMKGFYNIFHTPDAPYAITKIWGWIEYTALKETELTMTLYKIGIDGKPTDEIIASGNRIVSPGSDKSLLFDLVRPGESAVTPITIDCAFIAVLEGFDAEGSFTKLQPILGSGTVWEGDGECPWDHNCGVLLSWDENGSEEEGYYYDAKIYDEGRGSTKKLAACDFLWMVDGDFAWIFEKDGIKEVSLPLEGGSQTLTFNTYYSFNDPNVKINKDAEWIDFTTSPAGDNETDNGLVVNVASSDKPREGNITITGPAMNYVLKVKQSESSAVDDLIENQTIVLTEFYDISGRQLDEMPRQGLFLKVETDANGLKRVTKIMK